MHPRDPDLRYSDRQLEVAGQMLTGDGYGQIAQRLGIAEQSVKNCAREILRAAGIHSRRQLTLELIQEVMTRPKVPTMRQKTTMVMGLIEVLRALGLYAILFRNAGVGLQFYEGERDAQGCVIGDCRNQMKVYKYYKDLQTAVFKEHDRVMGLCKK